MYLVSFVCCFLVWDSVCSDDVLSRRDGSVDEDHTSSLFLCGVWCDDDGG